MKNMRIATKLFVSLGGMGIVMLAFAGMLVLRMSQMNEFTMTAVSNRLPKVIMAEELNSAIAQMDSVTQQNAAMVEEATAAARSLAGEASEFTRQVARFNLGDASSSAAPAASPVHMLQRRAEEGSRRIARAGTGAGVAAAVVDDDWSQF